MEKYEFGENLITFGKGGRGPDDYLLFQNGVQFSDREVFNQLYPLISTEKVARDFLKYFTEYKQLQCKFDRIETSPSPLDKGDVYRYCCNVPLELRLQELLFLSILRCDIDNINKPPPKYNGCIRFFSQILLLYAYKFEWTEYYIEGYSPGRDLPTSIYLMGYRKGWIPTFRKVYWVYLEKEE